AGRPGAPGGGICASLLLGVATGLLWAPCAGPILGIIFTAAALNGASANTTLLLLAYALGAATSLALALLAGGKLFQRMKKSLGASEWIRRALGVAVLVGVSAIALGLDTRVLAKLSSAQTQSIETGLARKLGLAGAATSSTAVGKDGGLMLGVEGNLPALDGIGPWINSPPLTREALRGKVVLIDFWTYSCINCVRSTPYLRAWHQRYADDGLVIIGVHAPEFAFERNPANVRKAVADMGIAYPVALDNDYALWKAMNNQYWPAKYFIDAQGRVRYHHFGEGKYAESEAVIRQLLREAGRAPAAAAKLGQAIDVKAAEAAAATATLRSPEAYLGYARAERFASPGGFRKDVSARYAAAPLVLNHWAYEGQWTVAGQDARLDAPGGAIVTRFHARDVHLVLAAPAGRPVRFRITVDGKAPGRDAGVDVAPDGTGTVTGERLYQLVRQRGPVTDRTVRIEFLDPGATAFAFTFG
uniref:thioredoxin family protein n=1 Tax=Sphingomonas sp. TaxID=28214 RepID=UPI00286D7411